MRADIVRVRVFEGYHTLAPTPAKVFDPNGRWRRVQQWAWKFLERTKALVPYQRPDRDYKEWTIEPGRAVEAILAGIEGIYQHQREPGEILIGSREFAEVMRDPSMAYSMFEFRSNDRYFYGVKVRVIPFMSGVVVLPKDRF